MLPPVPGPAIDPLAVFTATVDTMNAHNQWHDTLHRKANYRFDVKDFGAAGDGTTDDTAAIQAAIDAAQSRQDYAIGTGDVLLPPGQYFITDTLRFHRASGSFTGSGVATSPAYNGGHGSVLRWGGAADVPMVLVTDSRWLTFANMRLEGSDTAAPSFGFEFRNEGGQAGTNEWLSIRDVVIGEWPWTFGDTGHVATGVGFTGTNGNNDQMFLERVQIVGCEVGVSLPNSQSVWGRFIDVLFDNCDIGLSTAARTYLVNASFNRCDIDIDTLSSVTVDYLNSEHCGQLARIGPHGSLTINGGQFQVLGLADGVLVDMFPSDSARLHLNRVGCSQGAFDPSQARFVFGPSGVDPKAVGNFTVVVSECGGLHPDMLDLQGSFWASVPESQGSVEWSSTFVRDRFRFRNELSRGGRTVLDFGIWENE